MQTAHACRLCFERQIDVLVDVLAPEDTTEQDRLREACLHALGASSAASPPPEIAAQIYAVAAHCSGCPDPFAAHKKTANSKALAMLPELRERVQCAEDPLAASLRFAVIANYIDVGVAHTFDWEQALREEKSNEAFSAYPAWRTLLTQEAKEVLILGDNTGEIAIDSLLVQQLQALGHAVTYAVRGAPILNDATLEDARFVGLDSLCRVIETGVNSPGTLLHRCHPAFLEELDQADLVLSKGQGNFEALHGQRGGVFFAFKVKCPVVATLTRLPEQTSVFIRSDPGGGFAEFQAAD